MKQRPKHIGQLQSLVVPEMVDKWDSIAIQLGFNSVEIDKIKRTTNHIPWKKLVERCYRNAAKFLTMQKI